MMRTLGLLLALVVLSVPFVESSRADDQKATSIIDAAIQALGGEAKLAKATCVSWKSKGTITFSGNDLPIKQTVTIDGLERQSGTFELEVNGESVQGMAVLNGSKGWRKFGDNLMELDDEAVATLKQGLYLQAIGATLLPIKGKGFKVETAPEEKVSGKTVDVLKGTGPDGKSFTIAFDQETHLPVRLVATVKGPQGQEYVQETTYSDFKDFDGIKKATKSETKRDGDPFLTSEITDFKVLEKADPTLFDEPK
jgi:hypothetical protein